MELPSGSLMRPKMHIAGVDLWVNDVVWLDGDSVYPMCDDTHDMYGVVAANGILGGMVLVAT